MVIDLQFQRPAQGSQRTAHTIGERLRGQDGFTLIELFVVILVIGILAAIAIPLFLGTTAKAKDAQAKELVRTAATTAEAISSANGGSYEKVTPAELVREEATIPTTPSTTQAYVSRASGDRTTYTVGALAIDGDEYTISKNTSGELVRECISRASSVGCGGHPTSSW